MDAVVLAKLDRSTRSVKDLCSLLNYSRNGRLALVSVSESLDTGSAAGEREAIGERTREALRHKGSKCERAGNIAFGFRLSGDGFHVEADGRNPEPEVRMECRRRFLRYLP